MERTIDNHVDFDEWINWPDDLPPARDAAGAGEGRGQTSQPVIESERDSMAQSSPENAISGHAQPLAEVVPGYSANTPTNEDTVQVTTLTPAKEGVDSPSSGQASSSTNPSKKCACLVCLEIGVPDYGNHGPKQCHVVGCNWTSYWADSERKYLISEAKDCAAHAKDHYRQGQGPKKYQLFHCPVQNCRFNSKRWPDLQRHTTTKHCSDPVKIACSVLGCKHSGEGNGFTRKDKRTAHYESMHQGQRIPGQVPRALQPAPASSYPEASGSSSNRA